MKITHLKLIVLLSLSIIIFDGCEDPPPKGSCPACPSITSISPNHGRAGDEITIIGTNFEDFIVGEDQVTINSQEAVVSNVLPATLQVKVPEQAGSGPVVVNIGILSSTEVSDTVFFIYDEVRVDSLSPVLAKKDEIITIYGELFDPEPEQNLVKFKGDKRGEVLEVSESALRVKVPSGAGTGHLQIIVDNITVEGPEFTYIPTATVSTFAGTVDTYGFENGSLLETEFAYPYSIMVDDLGELYVADEVGVRKISGDKVSPLKIFPSSEHNDNPWILNDLVAKADGTFYGTYIDLNSVCKFEPTQNGKPGELSLKSFTSTATKFPKGLALDSEENLYVADEGNHRVLKLGATGDLLEVYGDGNKGNRNGSFQEAQFSNPTGLCFDNLGNLLITEQSGFIRMVSPQGEVSTLAGMDGQAFRDGLSSQAQFNLPGDIAVDTNGNVFISDYKNHSIRMISPTGFVSTIAGHPLRRGHADGDGVVAEFDFPFGMVFGANGDLYVADTENYVIRKITLE